MSFNLTVYGHSDHKSNDSDLFEDIEQYSGQTDEKAELNANEGFVSKILSRIVFIVPGSSFIILVLLLLCFDPIETDFHIRQTCLRRSQQLWNTMRAFCRNFFHRIRQIPNVFYQPVNANDNEVQ